MPYTLSMALLWVALAVLLGIVVGWLMRSVVAKRQVERARANHLDNVELERLRARVAELEAHPAPVPPPTPSADTPVPPVAAPVVAEAGIVLDGPVVRDDLTVVEGIGPTVAELCTGIGIQTWSELAQTEVSLLRTMLHDAGPRFRSLDPASWPEQARLLDAGRWDEFRALTEQLRGGQRVD